MKARRLSSFALLASLAAVLPVSAATMPAVRRAALTGALLLCSCAQQPAQPPPEGSAQSQAIRPPQVVSIPSTEIAAAPPTEPSAYSDQAAYAAAIRARVRRNLVVPRNVPDSASATVEVALSDKGTVTSLRTVTSSGYPAYDAAIRQAIRRAQPYPLLVVPGRKGPLTMRLRFQNKE
jgi:TonB family protein